MRRNGHREDARRRQSGDEDGKRLGETCGERIAPAQASELGVRCMHASHRVAVAPVHHELGRSAQEFHEQCAELAPRRGLAPSRRPAEVRGERGDGDSADDETHSENRRGFGQDDCGRDDACGSRQDSDERRPDPAEVETLESVNVPDHAGEEIPAAECAELGGGQRLDAGVEAGANPGERPQSEVVRSEALEVTRDRPRQPEKAHEDDRHGQRQDRRMLGSSRDEIPRRRHERDAEADRERTEEDREADPPGRHPRERE